jgi:hypothetical protein
MELVFDDEQVALMSQKSIPRQPDKLQIYKLMYTVISKHFDVFFCTCWSLNINFYQNIFISCIRKRYVMATRKYVHHVTFPFKYKNIPFFQDLQVTRIYFNGM